MTWFPVPDDLFPDPWGLATASAPGAGVERVGFGEVRGRIVTG